MHDINYDHEHELKEHEFLGCCRNCRNSLNIIKPHIMAFAARLAEFPRERLENLPPDEAYRLFQLLDDLAHFETGTRLARLILDEPEIRLVLPAIRSVYTIFFSIHERHLARKLLAADEPWKTLADFPLYPRYKDLVHNQTKAMSLPARRRRLIFIGCGPVPITPILLSRLYDMKTTGLEAAAEHVAAAQQVVRCLGLETYIEIIHGDDRLLPDLEWDMALVAALAEPKKRIFSSLKRAMTARKRPGPVMFRTYTGMREVLYQPVPAEAIEGFHIVGKVYPTGRVNNTTIFVEPDITAENHP
ncbi:MAG: nicotianamine synthase [Deltaproteobacteria bacterium]|nr:nicotianamine synthase [Candidatus Anaeroferrophillacea bacterium]